MSSELGANVVSGGPTCGTAGTQAKKGEEGLGKK